MSCQQFTFKDAVDHCLDYLGANPGADAERDARRAVLSAYRNLATAHRWSYYYQRGRLNTVASQSTGTVTYTHTGGSNERQLTISGNTWPSWAAYGVVVISNVAYEVAERKSTTILTLSVNSNPGADKAAGTAYKIFRDTYPLPADFIATDGLVNATSGLWPTYVHPQDWLESFRLNLTTGTPTLYTITSDPNYLGRMAVRFFPAPDAIYPFDNIYQRRARPLVAKYEYKTGTATTANGSATITGTGTTWASSMVGRIIRFSADAKNYPSGVAGSNPAELERSVMAVPSATSITLDANADQTLTEVKYLISDPIDVESGAMLTAFLRMCEMEVAIARTMDRKAETVKLYEMALLDAKAADSRSFQSRSAGSAVMRRIPKKYHPSGADVG